MASGSNLQVVDLEGAVEESFTDKIIREKVWSLKSAFTSQHFAEVEGYFLSMKQKLELENKSWKRENELMENRAQIERLERLKAENELKECKRECLRLKKEQEGFNELVMSSEEDKRMITQLREEICELKRAKLKAENEVDTFKSKFEELRMRVFLLEKDLKLLKPEESVNNVRVSRGVVEEKVVFDENANSCENVNPEKTEVVCSDYNDIVAVGVNGDVGALCLVSGDGLGDKAVNENGKSSERVCNVKVEMGAVDIRENMVLGANGGSRSNLLENGDGNIGVSGRLTPQSQEIIEIADSDGGSSSRRKKLTKQGCQREADLGLEVVSNETKLLKRKQTSCSTSQDDDGGSDPLRPTKSQVLIQGHESVPVNHSAATTMFSGSNDRRNVFTPSRLAPTVMRKCEEKIRIGQNSRFQRSELVLDRSVGSDSEESSSSSESEEFDFSIDFSYMTKPVQANRNHRKWKSEAEMVAALEQEVELRLKAVCALFGQQAAVEKSSNFYSTFLNQGFDKVDAARGTALAEFLINGDPQGKLKKSVVEMIAYDLKGTADCRRLAIKYSKQLFEMYQQKGDPLFFY
ncbi:unnamed protein product [Dovyalis caffra]|uniref:FRIGIDA-like protein n=1 Tax=Dovyalis caffra TaxID=77055 RepID=A0AAV1RIU3_9ROSI|nr:unnamed protein product [Dovyalis caffra]